MHIAAYHGHREVLQLLTAAPRSVIYQSDRSILTSRSGRLGSHSNLLLLQDSLQAKPDSLNTKLASNMSGEASNHSNCPDDFGRNPLHIAAWRGHQEVVLLLLSTCPSWQHRTDHGGKTPKQRANKKTRRIFHSHLTTSSGSELAKISKSSKATSMNVSGMSCLNLPKQGDWAPLSVPIRRLKDVRKHAPGLCSFVASCGGGVFSNMFLVDVIPERKPESHSSTFYSVGSLSTTVEKKEAVMQPCMEDLEPIDTFGVVVGKTSEKGLGKRHPCPRDLSYRLSRPPAEAVVGEGSFGVVWRAMDRHTGQWFAVKIIEARKRGRANVATRDAEAANHIRVHPHSCLVTLFFVHHFVEERMYMLVMEYCSGGDMKQRIRQALREQEHPSLYRPPRGAISWIGQAFLGLEHLHLVAKALLRDLKAENIVIDAHGCAKIIDFGLARMSTESDGTWTFGVPPGSPGYISPEIIRGEKYGFPADIYSFGVLVWVLLSGGLVDRPLEPGPPVSKKGFGYSAYLDDYRLLHRCLDQPDRNNARPLSNQGKELVERLTHRKPEWRPDHAGIRSLELMRSLKLPYPGARKSEVDAWVSQTAIS